MAHNLQGRQPVKAASAIAQYVPVTFLAGASALSETVQRTGSFNELSFGVTLATVASPGDPVSIAMPGEVVKGIAGASLGAGALVAVGSTNGILIPQIASGGPASANLVAVRWGVGIAVKNAAAGDYFPVYLNPAQIV
jgi:hypothetical protein